MIYVLREKETGLYKIGVCRDESMTRRSRMPHIAAVRRKDKGRPCTLEFILWVPWPHGDEKMAHRFLFEEWVEGEWFKDSALLQELLGYMRKNLFFVWRDRFRDVEGRVPPNTHWLSRDVEMRKHQERAKQRRMRDAI